MDIFAEINEYIGTFEDVQGNVNVMGLVWEHDVDETIGIDHEVYVVWVDQIEDGFVVTPTFDAQHLMVLEDILLFREVIGNVPVEVYQSNINVIAAREAAPVQVWWFGANVVHGADAFFEEVISNCHMTSPYVQAIPYYWRTVYESFNVEFHNIEPHPGVHKALKLQTSDLVNMRHNVWQEYYFNCRSDERLFAYDTLKWGWGHDVTEAFAVDAYAHSVLGRLIDEHIRFHGGLNEAWKGEEDIKEILLAWDRAMDTRGWTHLIEEAVSIEDLAGVYLDLVVQDVLMAQEMLKGVLGIPCLVPEQIRLAERMVNTFDLQIQDGFGATDEMLHRWLAMVLLNDQTNIAVEGSLNQNHEVEISSSLSWEDA